MWPGRIKRFLFLATLLGLLQVALACSGTRDTLESDCVGFWCDHNGRYSTRSLKAAQLQTPFTIPAPKVFPGSKPKEIYIVGLYKIYWDSPATDGPDKSVSIRYGDSDKSGIAMTIWRRSDIVPPFDLSPSNTFSPAASDSLEYAELPGATVAYREKHIDPRSGQTVQELNALVKSDTFFIRVHSIVWKYQDVRPMIESMIRQVSAS